MLVRSWVALLLMASLLPADELPRFDFRQTEIVAEWTGPHHLAAPQATDVGMKLTITGGDPYLFGPARDYPAGKPLWLRLRFLRSTTGGVGQVSGSRAARTSDRARRSRCRRASMAGPSCSTPPRYLPERGSLLLRVTGSPRIEVTP